MVARGAIPDSWRHELALLGGELDALDKDIAAARHLSAHARTDPLKFEHREAPALRMSGEAVTLPGGEEILIRPIEPEDASELQRGMTHLSAVSVYRRFRAHITRLTPEELAYMTRVDHQRHEALAALCPAEHSGVGVARYVCDPDDPTRAHATYVVADAWQQRGVGSALIERLAARALSNGVQYFFATTLAADTHARLLLSRVADTVEEHDHDGLIEITVRLREPS